MHNVTIEIVTTANLVGYEAALTNVLLRQKSYFLPAINGCFKSKTLAMSDIFLYPEIAQSERSY